jgi:hypothetical protein
MWKKLRITFFAYILVLVAATTMSTRQRHADWEHSLWVTVYPINGDGSAVADDYINSLNEDSFSSIEEYIVEQSLDFNLSARLPVDIKLSGEVKTLPPSPPEAHSGISVVLWSLKMRWWAWRANNFNGPSDVKIFVLYFDPETNPRLRHSLGLRKGFLGVVNAFADSSYAGQNKVVLTHELMHALGASDQYDPNTNYPLHPKGFAAPFKTPLLPQSKATLMAGRIPLNENDSSMPLSLKQTVISPYAALEIGWKKE